MIYQEKNYFYNQNASQSQLNQFKPNQFQLKIIDNTPQRISIINQPLIRGNNEANIRRSTLMGNSTNKYPNKYQIRNSFVSQ
jgi:hypothetical protein